MNRRMTMAEDWEKTIAGMPPRDAIETLLEALRQQKPKPHADPVATFFRRQFGTGKTGGAIASALYASRGVTVPHARLRQVSGAAEGSYGSAMYRLRKKLEDTAYKIETDHRVGYWMTGPDIQPWKGNEP